MTNFLDKRYNPDLRFLSSMDRYYEIECNKTLNEAMSPDMVKGLSPRFVEGLSAFSGSNRFFPAQIENEDTQTKISALSRPDNGGLDNNQWSIVNVVMRLFEIVASNRVRSILHLCPMIEISAAT